MYQRRPATRRGGGEHPIESDTRSSNRYQAQLDDWLAVESEFDWPDDPQAEGASAPTGPPETQVGPERGERDSIAPSPRAGAAAASRRPPADARTVARRRRILALSAFGVVVATAVAVTLATSSGRSGKNAPLAATGTAQPAATSTPPTTTTTAPSAGTPSATRAQAQTPTGSSTPRSALRVTLPAAGALALGDDGAAVVALQKALVKLGFEVGTSDGSFGEATRAAVIAFQKAHGLDPDGIVGAGTAQKLNQALAKL